MYDSKPQKVLRGREEKSDIIDSLNKITDRNKRDLEVSISKLQKTDIIRIRDLCKNYDKLQKYTKLIATKGNSLEQQQKFKIALENIRRRELSEFQLQHAGNSIRKARLYPMAPMVLITLNRIRFSYCWINAIKQEKSSKKRNKSRNTSG